MFQDIGCTISIETIYQFIYRDKAQGGTLYTNLRWQNRIRKRRLHGRKRDRKFGTAPRKTIHDRDAIVEAKSRFGDLEIDTIIGKNHKQAIKYWLLLLNIFIPITADNGSEFAAYEEIEKKLGINFYFCDPYSSWQRGLNEHANGLIRQYLPKKLTLLR